MAADLRESPSGNKLCAKIMFAGFCLVRLPLGLAVCVCVVETVSFPRGERSTRARKSRVL